MKVTWHGHAFFSITEGSDPFTVLIDPWVENPKNPTPKVESLSRVDAILITHAHFDHIGNSVEILKKFPSAKLVANYEITSFLATKGVSSGQLVGCNKGGTIDLGSGWKGIMTTAVHSSGCGGGVHGGEAGGWILCSPKGLRLYHSGDTDIFGDQELICKIHKPTIALHCIGGHFTCGPEQAAYAVNNLLTTVKDFIPMHYGTFPALSGTPDQLKSSITRSDVKVHAISPGETHDKWSA